MVKSRILGLSIVISIFLLVLFLGVLQYVQLRNSSDKAIIYVSTCTIQASFEWLEELENDDEKWLHLNVQFYTRIEELLPAIQFNKLACIQYVLCKTKTVKIRTYGPRIYLLDQVFLI